MNKLTMCAVTALAILLVAPLAAQRDGPQIAPDDPHLAQALDLRSQALKAKDDGNYDLAADLARQAKAELALAQAPAPAPVAEAAAEQAPQPAPEPAPAPSLALPASYTVRAIDAGEKDCLSKIAGYPFVYGDRRKWTVLFKANKQTLKHPKNVDLILPGEVLQIPSIAGETREGSWHEGGVYPVFDDGK